MDNFNVFGKINNFNNQYKSREDIINSNGGNYSSLVDSINDFLSKRDNNGIEYDLNPIPNRVELQSSIEALNALKNSNYLAFDIETIGSIKDPSTFGITELSVVKNNNGNLEDLFNLEMGVDKQRAYDIQNLGMNFLNGAPLTQEQKESAFVTSKRIKYNLPNENNPEVNVANLIKSVNTMNDRIDANGNNVLPFNSVKLKETITDVWNTFNESINEGVPIVGHNIKNADIPWLNWLFEQHNLPALDFNKGTVIDTFELMKNLDGTLFDIYSNQGLSNTKGMMKLENLANMLNIEQDAHIASSDVRANIEMLTKDIDGTNILDILSSNLDNKNNSINITNDSNVALFSRKAIPNFKSSLDVYINKFGTPATYMNYLTTGGVFYNINNITYTPLENLNDNTKQMFSGSDGIYSLDISQYGAEGEGRTIISRGSLQEISDVIGDYFDIYNITDEIGINNVSSSFATRQTVINDKDYARRKFAEMFEGDTQNGYSYAKKMYESYNYALKKVPNLNKDNLKDFLYNKEIFPNFTSSQQYRDFSNMFQSIADTTNTVTPILDKIEEGITFKNSKLPSVEDIKKTYMIINPDVTEEEALKIAKSNRIQMLNEKRNIALKNSWDYINNYIEENSNFKPSLNMSDISDSMGYLNNASLLVNGEYKNINISTRDNAFNNFRKLVYSNNNFEGSELNNYNIKNLLLNQTIKDLNERGIIENSLSNELINSNDVINSINKISDVLFETRQNKINEYGGIEGYLSNLQNDTTRLNVKTIQEFNDGYKVGSKSLDNFVQEDLKTLISNTSGITNPNVNDFIDNAVNNSITNSIETFNMYAHNFNKLDNGHLTDDYKRIKGMIGQTLREELNYNEEEIASVADRIIGYNSSYLNRGYSVQLSKYTNDLGEEQYGIIAYDPKYSKTVNRDLITGREPEKALIQPLPKKDTFLEGNIETVKTGDVNSLNIKTLNSYIDNNGNIKFTVDDTITSSIRKGVVSYKSTDELYQLGNYEKAKNTIIREYRKPIVEAPGASNYQTITKDGITRKGYIPSLADTQDIVDIGNITTVLGDLWTKDEEYRNIVIDKIGKKDATKIHEKILNNLRDGKITDFHDIAAYNPAFGEYLVTNMIRGDDILQRIINSTPMPIKVEEFLQTLHNAQPSQILMPSKFKSLDFSMTKPEKLATYGHLNPLRRPQINQDAASVLMYNNELYNNAKELGINDINEFAGSYKNSNIGIHFGDIVRTSDAQDLYFSNTEAFASEGGVNNGVMAGMKQISTKDLEQQLNDFDINKFVEEYNKNHLDKTSYERIDDLLTQYKSMGLTNEQHSYVNPIIDRMYTFKDELKRINIDEELLDNFNVGDYVDNSTTISNTTFNGKPKEIKYAGPNGTISYIDKNTGKAYIKPTNPAFEQKKYILSSTEKTVGSSIWKLRSGEEAFEEGIELFGSLFGKGTGIAGYYEFGKHESGSAILGSPLNIITSFMRDSSEDTRKELLNAYNKNMKGYNARFIDDELNKAGKVLIIDSPNVKSNDIENVRNLINDISVLSEKSINEETRKTAKNIMDTINYYNENNLLYLHIKKNSLSEMISTANGEGGRGMAISSRTEQVLGSTFLPDTLSVDNNGRLVSIAQPIKEYHMEQLKNTYNYKEAEKDLFNIFEANRLEAGLKAKNPNGVVNVKLEDIALPKGDILTADVLADTVFSNYNGNSVLKVDLGDMYVTNPYIKKQLDLKYGGERKLNPQKAKKIYSQARQNYLYIPITNPLMINDEELYFSDTLNKSSEIIKLLQRKNEKDIYEEYGGVTELNSIIDKKIEELYGTLDKELNNKNGIMEKSLLSGRVKYSSNTLNSGIIQYNFTDESRTKIQNIHSDNLIKIVDGKPVYEDVVYTSKNMFEDIGIENNSFASDILGNPKRLEPIRQELIDEGILKSNGKRNIMTKQEFRNTLDYSSLGDEPVIGKPKYKDFINTESYIELPKRPNISDFENRLDYKTQVEIWSDQVDMIKDTNRNNYNKYKNIELEKKSAHDKWLSNKIAFETSQYQDYLERRIATINESITNTYLEKVGIEGLVLRHPAFHSGSLNAVNYRLNTSMDGKTVLLTEPIAKKLNADTDGDNIMVEMFLRNKNGHNVLMENDSKILEAHKQLLDMQQKYNQEYLLSKDINATDGLKFDISLEGFEKNLLDIHGPNALENINTQLDDLAYSVGIKARIDKKFIGYISNVNKNLRDSLLKEMENRLNNGVTTVDDLRLISDFTTRAEQKIIDVKHDSGGKLTTAGKYSEALNEMIEAKGNAEKVDKGFEKLYYATTNSAMFSEGEIPSLEKLISGDYDKSAGADELRAVREFFLNSNSVDSFKDPLNSNGYSTSIDTSLNILKSLEGESSSYVGEQKRQIINDSFSYTPNDDVYYSNSITGKNDVIEIKDIKKNDLGYSVTMYDKINDKTSTSIVKDYENFIDELSTNYTKNIQEKQKYIDNLTDKYKKFFVDDNLLNPYTTETTLAVNKYFKTYGLEKDADIINKNILDILQDSNYKTTRSDMYRVIRNADENTRLMYSSISGLTNEEEQILREGAEVFRNMTDNNTITSSIAKQGMRDINSNIIERGRKAKIDNEIKRQEFKNIIQDTANKCLTNSYNLDSINENIKPIIDINEIRKDFSSYGDNVANKFVNSYINDNIEIANANTKEFFKAFNTPKGKEEVLNWGSDLGEGKVGFGKYANLKLNEVSISDLQDILSSKGYNEYSEMISESKDRISRYINKLSDSNIENIKERISQETNISKISKSIDTKSLRKQLNDEIIARANKSKIDRELNNSKTTNQLMNSKAKKLGNDISENLKKDSQIFKSKYAKTAAVAIGILGLGTAIAFNGKREMDQHSIDVATQKRNNEKEEEYKESSPGVQEMLQQSPPSENNTRTIIDGIKMRISGKSTENVNPNNIIDHIGSAISVNTGTNVNVSSTSKDDREEISDHWIKEKLRSIF